MSRVPEEYDKLCDEAYDRFWGVIDSWWLNTPVVHVGAKVYIAGPMRRVRYFNYPAFSGAKDALENYGYKVLMADLTEEPNETGETDTPLKKFMQHDLPLLCQADCVFVLPGWQNSHGAKIEVHLAFQLDIPVYDILTGRDIVEVAKEKAEEIQPMQDVFHWDDFEKNPPFHPDTSKFIDECQAMISLHLQKSADYGSDADPFANVAASADFGMPAWVGCMVRANDKMHRIQKAAQGHALRNESLEDSLRDLAAYAVIGLVLLERDSEPRS